MSAPQLIPEWHANHACWLAWPSHPEEWLGDLHPVRAAVAAFATAVAGSRGADPRGEAIHMLVLDQAGEDSARRYLGATPARFFHIPFGDIWLRDTGPVFVAVESEQPSATPALAAACFAWDGWGGKYLFPHDPQVGERIAAGADIPVVRHPFVLEGGAIDGDGDGTVLTTRQCLLARNRDRRGQPPSEAEMERLLATAVGARRVIWLDRGLRNDHTDGHVDTLARFVAPGRVVCMRAAGPEHRDDPNRATLEDIAATLRRARDARGRALEVVEIPAPGPVFGPDPDPDARDQMLLPASYLNFYIGNARVVVPTYGSPHDDAAIAAIAAVFPDRETVGVDARAVLVGGGAFHCISKQQPRVPLSLAQHLEEQP